MIATHRPLGLLPEVKISDRQMRQLEALEAFDLWFVEERLRRKDLLPEDKIDAAILGLRRYFAMRVLGHGKYNVPSETIDTVWHTFLLFTREYKQFSDEVGNGFIHHAPFTSRKQPMLPPSVPYSEVLRQYFGARNEGVACGCSITPCSHMQSYCGSFDEPDGEPEPTSCC